MLPLWRSTQTGRLSIQEPEVFFLCENGSHISDARGRDNRSIVPTLKSDCNVTANRYAHIEQYPLPTP